MLDLGLAFYVTLTAAFLALSRRYPGVWVAAGTLAGIGCWQKGPHALCLFWAAVFLRAVVYKGDLKLRTRPFYVGCGLALALGLAWTVFQVLKFGPDFIETFYRDQLWRRWSEGDRVRRPWQVIEWIVFSWRGFGVFALLALFSAITWSRKLKRPHISEMAALTVLFLALTSVSEMLKPRYIIPFLPGVAAIAIAAGSEQFRIAIDWLTKSLSEQHAMFRISRWNAGRTSLANSVLLLGLIASGLPAAASAYRMDLDHSRNQAAAAQALIAVSEESEEFVCVRAENQRLLHKDHLLYYGNLNRSVREWAPRHGPLSNATTPLRGLYHEQNWEGFCSQNPDVTIESRHGPIIHWALRRLQREEKSGVFSAEYSVSCSPSADATRATRR
jgi:4-amino-4-deoxy-L-arabinose transferase-like glycosyltransferase